MELIWLDSDLLFISFTPFALVTFNNNNHNHQNHPVSRPTVLSRDYSTPPAFQANFPNPAQHLPLLILFALQLSYHHTHPTLIPPLPTLTGRWLFLVTTAGRQPNLTHSYLPRHFFSLSRRCDLFCFLSVYLYHYRASHLSLLS
jgi:hypothetical protein